MVSYSHGAPPYSTFPHRATPAPHSGSAFVYGKRNRLRVDAGTGERAGAAARGEGERVEPLEPGREREGEPGREAVAAPYASAGSGGSGAAVYGPPGCAQPPSAPEVVTTRRGAGSSLPGLVPLRLVLPARDERVELDRRLPQRRELARGRDEDARAPREQQRVGVAGAEVDGVAARELVPRERVVVAARMELPADRRDRPLAGVVDEREAAALRRVDRRRVHGDPARLELGTRELRRARRSRAR